MRLYESDFWAAVANTVNLFKLNPENFSNLLFAFKQDVNKNRFESFDEILFYCKHSADPVGRIVLELHGLRDEKLFAYSDSICTALQLTNFYQDVKIDIDKDRIYVPLDELKNFQVTEEQYLSKKYDDKISSLMKYQVDRAEQLFNHGRSLIQHLPGMLKHEIKWTLLGGLEILKLIKSNNYDVFSCRPTLNRKDMLKLVLKSFIM
jgi:squalene synthase HpnC